MEILTTLIKGINKDNWVVVALILIIVFMSMVLISTLTKKPLDFKIGPLNIKFGNDCESPDKILQDQAIKHNTKLNKSEHLIVDKVKTYVTAKEKQITKLYYDVMVRQMSFCDERIVEMRDLFCDEYSKLLYKKLEKCEDVRTHQSFKNYKMFIILALEYAVKEATYKRSVKQNHLAEFTIESWDAFIEQKTNATIALLKDEYDMNYPESLVSRKEIDESNERVFDKIRPIIVSMYRKARDISIETRGKVELLKSEMSTYLKGDMEEYVNLEDV